MEVRPAAAARPFLEALRAVGVLAVVGCSLSLRVPVEVQEWA